MIQSQPNYPSRTRRAGKNGATIRAGAGLDEAASAMGALLEDHKVETGLSFFFAEGTRPSATDIERLFTSTDMPVSGARISYHPDDEQGMLELLASGLTFDLTGLAPAQPESGFEIRHRFGIPAGTDEPDGEAITLRPGQHIAGGMAMMPVVRAMAGLAANLSLALPVRSVFWIPAGTMMESGYFARIVLNWLSGGAFPALGLTGVDQTPDGHVVSSGLSYFIGQEIQLEPGGGESAADTVKLAVRLIDFMVRHGPLKEPREIEGAGGETLLAEPSQYGNLVWIWRGS